MALATWTADPDLNLTTRGIDTRWVEVATLRALAALTTSYVASDHIGVTKHERLTFLIFHNWTDATSIEWYYEWSNDASTWWRDTNSATSTSTNTITANNQTLAVSADANIAHTVDVKGRYVRVSIKKTGGVGADAASVAVMGLSL